MINDCYIKNGNVRLVDPNCANINPDMVNAIPQYQDMYMFVELTAESRGRTVIITSNNGGIVNNSNSDSTQNVNFIGNNQDNDPNNPHYLGFTTNYYDGSTGDRINYESFGITNIKITVNSSYVPQVNIQFVDIRGLSFFNQETSPYRILFDFPPPIFTLTVKGYYGKMLSYRLHLVKYTSEFLSENGNFVIDANFISMTFAPLADILFRYVVNFPLMVNDYTLNSDTISPPKNTYELILKIKNLYSGINEKIKSDNDTKNYDLIDKKIKMIDDQLSIINNYKNEQTLKTVGIPFLIVKKWETSTVHDGNTSPKTDNQYTINIINSISEYNNILKTTYPTDNIPTKVEERLCIVFIGVETNLLTSLIKYKSILIPTSIASLSITINDIPNPEIFSSDYNTNSKTNNSTAVTKYSCLDITDYYIKLYKEKNKLNAEKSSTAKTINTKVNNIILEKLGIQPTIYNIFKIILNDVDTFFKELKTTSIDAENKHNEEDSKALILSNNPLNVDHIYSFPLIINQDGTICGGKKEERIAPIKLAEKIGFPEMDLVKKFINTFQTQAKLDELYSMRETQNADGTNVWIPISPLDSALANISSNSPYANISNGLSDSQDNLLLQTLNIFVKRYYMLSQGFSPYDFYIDKNQDYINFFAESEAINLVNSLINDDFKENVKINVNKFIKDINSFYTFITPTNFTYENTELKLSSFSNDIVEYFPIEPTVISNGLVYTNKNNPNFVGVNLDINDQINIRTNNSDSNNPIDKFLNENLKFFDKIYNFLLDESITKYSEQNLQYLVDIPFKGFRRVLDDTDLDAIHWKTRFLYEFDYDVVNNNFNIICKTIDRDDLLENGNIKLNLKGSDIIDDVLGNNITLALGGNIVSIWVDMMSKFDTKIYNKIINIKSEDYLKNPMLSALIILSNFGYTLGCFNVYPNKLNHYIFNRPAIIETPTFFNAYIGGLIIANEEDWIGDIIDFFENTTDNKGEFGIYNKGYYVFADIHDVNLYLSIKDKESFKTAFNEFYNGNYNTIINKLDELYKIINPTTGIIINLDKKEKYDEYLNPNTEPDNISFYNEIILPLIKRKNITNYSQITFKMDSNAYSKTYKSLTQSNADIKQINDSFFTLFFRQVINQISQKNSNEDKEEEARAKLLADEDIITQTYYSFKNINDKWLTTLPENNPNGYPFGNGKPLIDSFVFVDRAMNPVGNTMINAEILLDIFNDPNITLYSALSQILSINGFEFFPLQNFMKYSEDDWVQSFKIDTSNEVKNSPVFVCMYIGGSSSYPSTSSNGFKDDGISDISNPGVSDFSTTGDCSPISDEDNQKANNPLFPWREVNAFRVRFGQQNQSMFTNIKIDSKDYPETNESIQILSRLAGDGKMNAPTPKGQNLYNLYENRAYKATVTGLGNLMIQPTQYFQLENIPMFNGAYIILSVQHDIVANKITTTFSGTKILKYPIPRVTNPVVFVGLDELGIDVNYNQITSGAPMIEYADDKLISKWMTYYQGISKASSERRKIENVPTDAEYQNIVNLAKAIYDPLCDHFNFKIPTTTVFRGNELNKAVGGTSGSQHRLGEAVDMDGDGIKVSNSEIFYYIANNLEFDQLLWEGGNATNSGWVHCSFISDGRRPNRKIFTIYNDKKEKYSINYTALSDFEKAKETFYG